jgi:hypothetical protein
MNYIVSALILFYGGILTFATVFAIGFGNAFSGWGDGATVRHVTSFWDAWPTALFFLISASGPFIRGAKWKGALWVTSLLVTTLCFLTIFGEKDGFFLSACLLGFSLIVWIPLIAAGDPSPEDSI